MAEFNTKKGKGGLTDKTLIIDKDGSLETADEYEQISEDPNAYHWEKPAYFLKFSKIRGIIFCSENVCTRKPTRSGTMLYKSRLRSNPARRGSPPFGNKGCHETAEAPLVTEFSSIRHLGSRICVLDGTYLTRLRDGLCRCSPGIIVPAKRLRKHFWGLVGS